MNKQPEDQPHFKESMTNPRGKNQIALTLGALGVVFGDIGTSPLYAVGQCFHELHGKVPDPSSILGILSLIFWSLILVVCVKYVTFVLRADYNGEGGTLALLGLIQTRKKSALPPLNRLVLLVFVGSALLYGDSVITPSISVLSAVEGLKIATPSAQPFIVPICLSILVGFFFLQRRGTGSVGAIFGPVMIVWFVVIGWLGVIGIAQAPQVLAALNPLEALRFLTGHGMEGILVLGAVVLCFSGAEALFADLGHFGRFPIRLAWYVLVLPSLLLNYFGQGALVFRQPAQAESPFYALVPPAMLYPMVALSTVATIIASQAVISGAFSLTEQAINMGYFPRFPIIQTSEQERGQIYVGIVNWALMLACLAVVVGFRSSDRLSGAYGLAVIGTMTTTSLTYFVVLRRVWKWSAVKAVALAGTFLVIDLSFLAGNLVKILSGAWVPLLIGGFVLAIFWIWTFGHNRYLRELKKLAMPVNQFTHEICHWQHRIEGTAVFLSGDPHTVPLVGQNQWLQKNARHERVLLLTVIQAPTPFMSASKGSKVEKLGAGFFRITTEYGFMQQPNVTEILKELPGNELTIDWETLVCYLPEPRIVAQGGWWKRAIQRIYDFLRRNSLSAADYFRIPPREVVHSGLQLDV
jgi:KUP system potassium uptake protein